MTGPIGRARATGRWASLPLAVLAAAAVLALGWAGAERSRTVAVERRLVADQKALAAVSVGLSAGVDHALTTVMEAAGAASLPAAERPPGFVAADASTVPATAPVLSSRDRAERDVEAVLDRARDTGDAVLSSPVDLGQGPFSLVVAAAYASDAAGPPRDTVARRDRLLGWVVQRIDPIALVRPALQEGLVAAIHDGAVVWSTTASSRPARLPEATLDVGDRRLTVEAGDPSPIGIPLSAVLILGAAGALALVAAASVVAAARRTKATEAAAKTLANQVQLIGDVAPLVQQSLDLAEVLPAVAVQLSDHFGLAGVVLSTVTTGGGPVELFSLGAPPDPHVKPVLRPPPDLAAGSTLALALQRGGRSAALLSLVAGRALGEGELRSLRALSELVTAAVVNASLYASQQDAMARLRDLDALKTVFLGTASHELRTPVTAIEGFASLLTDSWDRFDEEQRHEFVKRIAANARSLGGIVQDLLDFSVLDKGTLLVTIEEVDLDALVASVVERLAPVFPGHTIAYSATPAPTVAGAVTGLERIVTNLLTNAAKFSPGGTTVTVSVGPAQDGYGAQLVVIDEGPGVPVEERGRVFARFFRGSGDAVTHTRGVGIGLSVVAEFVARMRGDVAVDDAPGGGARFTVRLPASSDLLLAKEAAHAPTS